MFLVKTKNEKEKPTDKPRLFHDLSYPGISVLVLLSLSLFFGVTAEIQKKEDADTERKTALIKQKNDSMKHMEILDNEFAGRHPISPLQVFVTVSVQIHDSSLQKSLMDDKEHFSPGINNGLISGYKNRNTSNYPPYLSMGGNLMQVDNYYRSDTNKYDEYFVDCNNQICNYILPTVIFCFFKGDTSDLFAYDPHNTNADLCFSNSWFPVFDYSTNRYRPYEYSEDYRISYQYDFETGTGDFTFSYSDPYLWMGKSNITSMYDIRNGYLTIDVFPSSRRSVELKTVEFRCGVGFFDRYLMYFDDSDKIFNKSASEKDGTYKKQYIYLKRGGDILKGK